MENLTSINYYEKLFNELGKTDLFSINKPFLEELVDLKNRIISIRSDKNYKDLIVHPFNPSITRPTESSKYLLKLLNQYTEMTKVLNKLLGTITVDDDPIGDWLKAQKENS